jgi:hypothetical protein
MPDHDIPLSTLPRRAGILSLAALAQDERPARAIARQEVDRRA